MDFLIAGNEGVGSRLGVGLVLGALVGVERELRNKPAGISTTGFVMAGACLFTFGSMTPDPNSPARVAAQVVSGVGFLGAGMIIKGEGSVKNLTTAIAVWFAAAIGMVIGVGGSSSAGARRCTRAIVVPRIPHVKTWLESDFDECVVVVVVVRARRHAASMLMQVFAVCALRRACSHHVGPLVFEDGCAAIAGDAALRGTP
jgi:putative Mg2+ transporter-C (MgtC) family protein